LATDDLSTYLDREPPEVIYLAMLGSLAARLEPQLIRALRLQLAPKFHPCVEADLWFSTLVETRAATGIVLKASIVPELRKHLAADKSLLNRAWEVTERLHRRGSPSLLAEEELSWLTLRGLDEESNRARATLILRRLIATLVTDNYPNLVNWAGRAILRLPRSLFALQETKMLALGSAYRGATFGELLNEEAFEGWGDIPWLQPRQSSGRTIGVRFVQDGVEIGPPGLRGGHPITLPLRAAIVKVSWFDSQEKHGVAVKVDPSKTQLVETQSREVRIAVIGGSTYRLKRTATGSIGDRRGPRVQITYPSYEGQPVELPFVVGVLADLVGNLQASTLPSLEERRFKDIDFDSFDSYMTSVSPGLSLTLPNHLTDNDDKIHVDLSFATMDDFAPGRIAKRVPALGELLNRREELEALASLMEGYKDVKDAVTAVIGAKHGATESAAPEEFLMEIARTTLAREPKQLERFEGGMRVVREEFGNRVSSAFPFSDDFVGSSIARIDRILTDQMNEIFDAAEFRTLEGAWRGLHYLVFNSETDEKLKIRVMLASKAELYDHCKQYVGDSWDQSPLFKRIYEETFGQLGGEPFGCLVGDYYFSHRQNDVEFLEYISKIAAAAHSPFIAAAAPHLLGLDKFTELANPRDLAKQFDSPDYGSFKELRDSEDARYLGLCLPRVLARVPYGPKLNAVAEFRFEEKTSDENYTWMNPCYAMAANINRAFKEYGWCSRIRGIKSGGAVANLPAHVFPTDEGAIELVCPTEVALWDQREGELARAGLMALVFRSIVRGGGGEAAFVGAQSLARPRTYQNNPEATASSKISVQLPFLFAASRFAHYIKVMVRDRIGGYISNEDLMRWVNDWIADYVDTNSLNSSEEEKAKRPLSGARISIDGNDHRNPGYHSVDMDIRPQYQFEEMDVGLRLVTKLPRQYVPKAVDSPPSDTST
jgi:type VI secretion system protein ImpC